MIYLSETFYKESVAGSDDSSVMFYQKYITLGAIKIVYGIIISPLLHLDH